MSGRRPINFTAVRASVSLADVLELIGWEPNVHAGDGPRGSCPICGSGNPKARYFHIGRGADGNLRWFCHKGCGGGNHLDLWCKVHSYDLYDGAVALCEAAGVPIPYLGRRS